MWGVWPQPSFFVINVRNWRDLWMEPEHGAECAEGRTERQQETGPLVTSLEHWTQPHLNSLLSSMHVITFSHMVIICLDLIINITAFWAPESVWGQLKLPGLHHSWPLALPHPASSLPQGLILRKFHLGLFFLGNTKHDSLPLMDRLIFPWAHHKMEQNTAQQIYYTSLVHCSSGNSSARFCSKSQ